MRKLLMLLLAVMTLTSHAQPVIKSVYGIRDVDGVLNWRNSPKGALKGPPLITGSGTADGSETKIVQGTNVTVTGTGTSVNPYVINSPAAGSGSSSISNQIVVTTPTVAAIQSAIDQVATGQSGFRIICGFNFCNFGDAETIRIANKTNFTLDLNGASLIATSTREMIRVDGACKQIRITNGKIFNNSPTMPYNSKYGYFATITCIESAQVDGLEIDHIEGTTPNADQDFILFSTYRDVPSDPGSTALMRGTNIHDMYLHHIGRMGLEAINGGWKYGDKTYRHIDTRFTNNRVEQTGLKSLDADGNTYGCAVSLDGAGENAVISGNTLRNLRGNAIEVVNGRNMTITANTITDDVADTGPGCVGISITDNRRFITTEIAISANTVNVKKRAIQMREATYVTITGNSFTSILGNYFIAKRCNISGNLFHATAPIEPVVLFNMSGENSQFWTSTENTFSNNTVTSVNPNKPTGYGGPYQLLSFRDGSRWNTVLGNTLIQDPAAGSFPYIEFGFNSERANNYIGTDLGAGFIGTNVTRIARDLGYGD